MALLLTACDSGPSPEVGRHRCTTDGLCIVTQTDKTLSGGYRRDGIEVGFDAVYRARPPADALMGGSQYCERITLDTGHILSGVRGGNCPVEWSAPAANNPPDRMAPYLVAVAEMGDAMRAHGAPSGWGESWAKILFHIDETVRAATRQPSPSEDRVDPTDDILREGERQRFQRETGWQSADDVYAPDAHASSTDVILAEDEVQPCEPFSAASSCHELKLDPMGSLGSSSSFGRNHGSVPATSPAEVTKDANFEFKQAMHLHSQNIRSGLLAGWKTKKHHSASVTDVYRRRRGSLEPWEYVRRMTTRNHGAEPGWEDMEQYATCDQFPVTRGYYIVGGECTGGWLSDHFCNDDTALQIFHAYGAWDQGHRCFGRYRVHKPYCDKPW